MASTVANPTASVRLPSSHIDEAVVRQTSQFNINNVGICASRSDLAAAPTSPSPSKRRKTKVEDEALGTMLRKNLVKHQLGLSLNLIVLAGLAHLFFPSVRNITTAFFTLSYPTGDAGQYGQGPLDLYFISAFVIYFTGLRAFMMDYLLLPLAQKCGIRKRKAQDRFAEQAHLLVYYLVYWSWGLNLLIRDTPANTATAEEFLISLWNDFPRLVMAPELKLYYLTQLAFWAQQVLVIHIEERRKDHYQMLTHHFITIALMVGSYGYRQWRVGTAILVCMDIVDLVFPTAKIFRYLGLQTLCDITFGIFVITWIIARHVFYLAICWSIYAHVPGTTHFRYGTYSTITGERLSPDGGSHIFKHILQPIINPSAPTVAFNQNIRSGFLALLLGLQAITLGWLVMIMGVVIRVLRGQGADDSRSDGSDESDGEALDLDPTDLETAVPSLPLPPAEKPRFIEIESSSEDLVWPLSRKLSSHGSGSAANNLHPSSSTSTSASSSAAAAAPSASSSRSKISKGISSGLNLGEHKDLLNRIGCLSEEQLAREREKREGSSSPGARPGMYLKR